MTPPAPAFTLRQLPLPAKLVISVFLVAVGVGYFSALVQLHMQHSNRDGEALPTPADVVAVFAGVKKADPNKAPEEPVSKLERLVMGPIENAPWNGSGSMAAAFFKKDGDDYAKLVKEYKDDAPALDKLNAERNGERAAVRAWIRLPDADRKAAFEKDAVPLPADLAGKPITADYLSEDKKSVKVKSILDARCVRCHGAGGQQANFPLESYGQYTKYLELPKPAAGAVDGWVPSGRQTSIEKLTQSTHAHLLSFAMLFALTGLTFAFTGFPTVVRCILGPLVLVAQVADVSCWWLARIPGPGPYFAMAIVATGGVVGMGLAAQIILSLFSMYGPKGRGVVAMVFIAGGVGISALYLTAIAPGLAAEKAGPSVGESPAKAKAE